MKTNTATLIGNVTVTQGQNVVQGERLVMDMTTGVARFESDKSSKGQVKALFLPNNPNAQPGNASGPGGAKETKPSAPLKIN
jgi:lipopolysaccharide export system protein LptA